MKTYVFLTTLLFLLLIPLTGLSQEINESNKPPIIMPLILEIYEDGKKTGTLMYVDLQIRDMNHVQWDTVYLDSSLRIKQGYPKVVNRWDNIVSDIKYDKDSFQLKLDFGTEEHMVRGTRISINWKFKVESVGFRPDYSEENKFVKIEWKSIE